LPSTPWWLLAVIRKETRQVIYLSGKIEKTCSKFSNCCTVGNRAMEVVCHFGPLAVIRGETQLERYVMQLNIERQVGE
jgi:hypothetical protein